MSYNLFFTDPNSANLLDRIPPRETAVPAEVNRALAPAAPQQPSANVLDDLLGLGVASAPSTAPPAAKVFRFFFFLFYFSQFDTLYCQ
jgi:hypothetical protein